MSLPQRVWFTVQEVAARWGCHIADIAGWAATGLLKIVTGVQLVTCGDRTLAGLVEIQPMEILPMFRRCGTGPLTARIQRIRPFGEEDWLTITKPKNGRRVSLPDLLLGRRDVEEFEVKHDLGALLNPAGRTGGDDGYDWIGMNAEITRRVFEEGLPESQAAWISELQEWFASTRDDGKFPDERSVRRHLKPTIKALNFHGQKRG
jgi:hypothetical protein